MFDFERGGLIGLVLGVTLLAVIVVNFGIIPRAKEMRQECEKDLARNLKCEMVYLKPSIKEGE